MAERGGFELKIEKHNDFNDLFGVEFKVCTTSPILLYLSHIFIRIFNSNSFTDSIGQAIRNIDYKLCACPLAISSVSYGTYSAPFERHHFSHTA
jgi:hypothetical protein